MSVLVEEPTYTASEWAGMLRSPTKNKSYQSATRLGAPIRDFLAWKQLSGAAERTLDQYERDLSACALFHPDLSVEEWTERECLDVLMRFPAKSRRRASAPLRGFFKWSVAFRLRDDSPMDRLPSLRAPVKETYDIFEQDEELALCMLSDIRDRALMLILFRTGIRRGEALQLQMCDVDLEHGRLLVRRSKSRRPRIIPLDPGVIQTLSELAVLDALDHDDYLWWTRPQGREISRAGEAGMTSFGSWWKRCLADAGVRYRNPHTTRHTFATTYLRAGGRLERLARILGHSSVAITDQFYAHLVTDDLAEDMNLVLRHRGLLDS